MSAASSPAGAPTLGELEARAAASAATLEHMAPGAGELLEAYSAERDRHGFVSPLEVEVPSVLGDDRTFTRYAGRCGCGWQQARPVGNRGVANRAAGMHRTAAEKRASKAYDDAVAHLIRNR